LKLVPAIDVQQGVVVRGVGGRRAEYQPIQSLLTSNPSPEAVIDALANRFDFDEFYLADLDGLTGRGANEQLLRSLAVPGWRLIVDAGCQTADQAVAMAECGANRIVAASESVSSASELDAMLVRLGAERIVWSMDLKNGRPIVQEADWLALDAAEIVERVAALGVQRFILLDLADVGEGRGTSTLPLLQRLRSRLPDCWFAVGGGVRSDDDVKAAEQSGADALLIASALHDGSYPFC
jgi:phosphoribosylformimino-5-aminoimidazole carboxamide ribotide isomerase